MSVWGRTGRDSDQVKTFTGSLRARTNERGSTAVAQLAQVPASDALVPPQNLEAEESILGAVMLSPGAITACREIISADGHEFYRESHARIWRAALRLADRGEPVDVITLTDDLAQRGELEDVGGRVNLHQIASTVPATANAGHYARIVVEQAQRRDLIRIGDTISSLGWNTPGEAADLIEQARTLTAQIEDAGRQSPLEIETWAQFERSATETIPMLVDALWPEAGLGFIAAPPKKGKTWVALDLAISVATGTPFLASFDVAKPEPVVYLALEGHRAAIRGRIGALAHGHGLQPQGGHDLDRLHIVYKPAGLNLADPAWIRTVTDLVQQVGARLVIVDVLRAAAVMKENSNDEFRDLIRALQPLQQAGSAIALLHHFGKLTEVSKERTPGERMSGAGAMYGAFDVGVFITKSGQGARELRVEFETRDVVAPDPIGVRLTGEASGQLGGFVFSDAAAWTILDEAPEPDKLKAPPEEIAAYVLAQGGEATLDDLEAYFETTRDTIKKRTSKLWSDHQIEFVLGAGRGAKSRFVHRPTDPEQQQLSLPPKRSDKRSDPLSSDSDLYGGRSFTSTKTLDSAFTSESSESSESEDSEQKESADLQGFLSSESSDSPTEREASADAAPLPEAGGDIDWAAP